MRKVISLLLTLFLIFSLCGCTRVATIHYADGTVEKTKMGASWSWDVYEWISPDGKSYWITSGGGMAER